jgi:hypothetical protein
MFLIEELRESFTKGKTAVLAEVNGHALHDGTRPIELF